VNANNSATKQPQEGSYPSSRPDHQRVVVTGMSAITPVGNSITETWDSLINGRSGAGPVTILDVSDYACQIAAELKDFDPAQFIPRKKLRQMGVATQMAVVTAKQAIQDAALDLEQIDRDRMGVVIGTSGGNTIEETELATKQLLSGKKRRLLPSQIMRLFPNMPSYFISWMHNLRGYNLTVCTACASGTQAIGTAAQAIQRGDAELMLAGATDTMTSETALGGFTAMRALATSYNDDPSRAMRPFDADREGFIAGMGSATLVLERLDHALARGARVHAEVLGSGVSNDAFHVIAPDFNGAGAALAMRRGLNDAGIDQSAVDYINAHGTSTPLGDVSETKAIKLVFGEQAYQIPISSTKSMIGHLMGAAGGVEAAVCIMTLKEGIIHPTINYETPDPECDLDYVPNIARKAPVKIAMSNSFGLGGQNACVVLGSYQSEA
jgi:3-oxoacyl-[acyl-carrier-protein] synthase II